MEEHGIWSNMIDVEEWEDFLNEEYPEVTNEDEKYSLVNVLNNEYLNIERKNLNIKVDGEIICIADLGLWNGRRSGYKIVGNNISDCLYDECCDHIYWYCDRYNFRGTGVHHDGTNYYLYRMIRPELTQKQRENFLKLIGRKMDKRVLRRYTVSLVPYIRKVYGW